MIERNTNVRSYRFGAGAIDGVGRELGNFIVTTYGESRPDLWYRVINEQEITSAWVEAALSNLQFRP